MNKATIYEKVKLLYGLLIMLAIFFTEARYPWAIVLYIGIGGGGTVLVMDYFTRDGTKQ